MKKVSTKDTIGPLFNKDGTVAVDPACCPVLHRVLTRMVERQKEEQQGGWARVVELRAAGEADAADRLVRKLLGVQGPPMTEEKKAELRAYAEAHKEEIQQRKKQKREVRRRTVALLTTGRRK